MTVYIEVPDPAATLQTAAKNGGTVMMEPMEVPGTQSGLVIAMFSDPEGNVIGLAKEGTM